MSLLKFPFYLLIFFVYTKIYLYTKNITKLFKKNQGIKNIIILYLSLKIGFCLGNTNCKINQKKCFVLPKVKNVIKFINKMQSLKG
ncbi:hypothetical protein CQA75_04900 [Campylobacter taeniopygiae]|uniref:Uncharacterized protein n=1 Tax=Campylobacter taeniopygiae TaxID=2510188 RepID=A0ABY2TIA2_9BACT|nr:hypothetical protein CQA75_04900 [Campylobacter taeniopygiae]